MFLSGRRAAELAIQALDRFNVVEGEVVAAV
jgi:hypothetical protein